MLGSPRKLPRESPKDLPGPLHVSGRVLVSVKHEATGGAGISAPAQRLGHALPTATTVLAVKAGGTATTRRPASAALAARMVRNCAHPASLMLLARWWFRPLLATCKSSREMVS